MKHFLSFSLALCSIVLAALFSSPSFGTENKTLKKTELSAGYGHHNFNQVSIFKFMSNGTLPEKCILPGPKITYMKNLKNDRGRERENLKLNAILRKDKEPESKI